MTVIGIAIPIGIAALGVVHVGPTQRLLVRRDAASPVSVYEPGWHWRFPLPAQRIAVPLGAVALERDVAVRSREGAQGQVHVSGEFAVAQGDERRYADAAADRRFSDVVWAAVEPALVARADDLVAGGTVDDVLRTQVARQLSNVGVRVEGLDVRIPRESNPAVAAQARATFEALADASAPHRRKVLLVGWDGADWQIIRPLMAAGRMPNLKRLVSDGVSGNLRSQQPMLSPLVWTTIATGKPVTEHGVADFLVRDGETGALVPIASTARRVHALWTILTALGRRSDVIGFWATWPAEPILGTMVTDRVEYQLFGYEGGKSPEGKVYPPSYWDRVKQLTVTADAIGYPEVKRYVDIDESEYTKDWNSLPADRRQESKINHLRKVLASTATYTAIALDLLKDQPDLTIVYFEGTDTVAHLFARYLPPRMPMVTDEEVRKFGHALPEYYVTMDDVLGRLERAADPDTEVIILSDHGFFTGELRPESDPANFATGAVQWHRLDGIIAAAGGGVKPGTLEHASVFDITPTVLAILGLPVPGDMHGKVLSQLLGPGVTPSVGKVASYEALPRVRPGAVERSAAADRERMKELVALGYISPGALDDDKRPSAAQGPVPTMPAGATSPDRPTPPTGAAAPADEALPSQQVNLGAALISQGKLAEAEDAFRKAIAMDPTAQKAYDNLALLQRRQGKARDAYDTLAAAVTTAKLTDLSILEDLVEAALHAGTLEQARALLARMRNRLGTMPPYQTAWGHLELAQGNIDGALSEFDAALRTNPENIDAIRGKVVALRTLGRDADARRFLESGIQNVPATADSAQRLALVALDMTWPDLAEPLLRKALAADPDQPGLLLNMGVCLAQEGRGAEATGYLQRVLTADPHNSTALFNLGFIAGEQGRPQEALAYFEKAEAAGLVSAQLHIAKSRAYFFLHDLARCTTELQRALEIEPANPEARRLLTALQQQGGVPSGGGRR